MDDLNKLLKRQLKRKLKKETEIPSELDPLLAAISDSYNHYEADRTMLERSLEISSNELTLLNRKLEDRNVELQNTIDELTRTKVGKKAASIVLLIAMLLFILSEGVIEPIIEMYSASFIIGFISKGGMALLLKPIETIIEKFMLTKAMGERKIVVKQA